MVIIESYVLVTITLCTLCFILPLNCWDCVDGEIYFGVRVKDATKRKKKPIVS
jgi:hypothetical protein